jgi:very-short-patch-repair endonuclease
VATARDRDRLSQLVLERLGWRILRIWSTDWWTDATRECDRLHAMLQAALER